MDGKCTKGQKELRNREKPRENLTKNAPKDEKIEEKNKRCGS
jgi:hypothetical protein